MLQFYYKRKKNFEKTTSFDAPKTLNFYFFWVSIFGIAERSTGAISPSAITATTEYWGLRYFRPLSKAKGQRIRSVLSILQLFRRILRRFLSFSRIRPLRPLRPLRSHALTVVRPPTRPQAQPSSRPWSWERARTTLISEAISDRLVGSIRAPNFSSELHR